MLQSFFSLIAVQVFFAMEPFDVYGNITESLFKLILNTDKEMFYLTTLM